MKIDQCEQTFYRFWWENEPFHCSTHQIIWILYKKKLFLWNILDCLVSSSTWPSQCMVSWVFGLEFFERSNLFMLSTNDLKHELYSFYLGYSKTHSIWMSLNIDSRIVFEGLNVKLIKCIIHHEFRIVIQTIKILVKTWLEMLKMLDANLETVKINVVCDSWTRS